MSSYDLVIWDCDGCLVDSEGIACGIEARYLTRCGYPVDEKASVDRLAGKTTETILDEIYEETGLCLKETFPFDAFRAEVTRELETALRPIDGVHEAIEKSGLPVCVASGSLPQRVELSLRKTGLFSLFEGRIFSSSQVERGKPAPDVFLFAANQMAAAPERCLVIEDSTAGVSAAHAAGMKVFAFMGGSHISALWRERVLALQPHAVFDCMAELPALIRA